MPEHYTGRRGRDGIGKPLVNVIERSLGTATVFEVETVTVPATSIEHLSASKRTGRLQDAGDIETIEEIGRLRG